MGFSAAAEAAQATHCRVGEFRGSAGQLRRCRRAAGGQAGAGLATAERANRHTGIGLHTLADVHFGLAAAKAADRRVVLAEARARNPHRFGGITTAPKMLDLPDTVWINRPIDDTNPETETEAA